MSYFTWGGYSSEAKYVIVDEYPDIVRPPLRLETVRIPGRDGDLTLMGTDAYEPYDKGVKCIALPAATLTDLAGWLKGSGYVVFGNEPLYKYPARIAEQIDFATALRGREHRRFTVKFRTQPWKELATTPEDQVVTSSGTSVSNAGTLDALPVLTVTGSGTVTVLVGSLYSFTLTGMSSGTPLRLDCAAGIVTDEDVLVNYTDMMSGQFPRLIPGSSTVSWTGSVTSIAVTKNQRWL